MTRPPKEMIKRRAWRFGQMAEALCIVDLTLRGYRVVGRRIRYPVGEIDIVARRGRTLAVIEVKARKDLTDAAEAVSRRQQNRITKATEWLLNERPGLGALQPRFDVMLVAPWRRPRHLGDAWRQESRS
jgi:putative endonuclease